MRNRPWEEKWAIQEAKAGSKGEGLWSSDIARQEEWAIQEAKAGSKGEGLWSSYIARVKNIEKGVRGIKG